MKNNNKKFCGIFLLLGVLIVFYTFKLYSYNKIQLTFYDASFIDIVTVIVDILVLLIGSILVLILTIGNEKKDKQRNILLSITEDIESLLTNKLLLEIKNKDETIEYHMLNTQIKYRLDLLVKNNFGLIEMDTLEYIKSEYIKHENTIGDYIDNLDKLNMEKKKLTRYISNTSNKLLNVKLELYK